MSTIRISQVSKSFKAKSGPVHAVVDLDMQVVQGDVLGFLGPNGAGKTTTIKMICGLMLPNQGEIHVRDINVCTHRRRAMTHIGAVLEGTRNIYWRLSPLQNLAYAARLKGVQANSCKAWGEILLQELALWDRRHDPVREFSRGMQQKTAIACALIHDPSIVLLDEPTLGLDINAAITVKHWIKTLSAQYGKTLVLTTHQLDLAEELCQSIAIMQHGRKVADHTVQELRNLHRKESVIARIAAVPEETRSRVQQQWPEATMRHESDVITLTIPSDAGLRLADVAAVLDRWPCDILSLEQSVPSLEDIFIKVTDDPEHNV